MDAYNILIRSKNEYGGIPLSELDIYANRFGLIGSFSEFVGIIYAIDNAYNLYKQNKKDNK